MIEVVVFWLAVLSGVVAGLVAEFYGRNFWFYFIGCAALPGAALIAVPYIVHEGPVPRSPWRRRCG